MDPSHPNQPAAAARTWAAVVALAMAVEAGQGQNAALVAVVSELARIQAETDAAQDARDAARLNALVGARLARGTRVRFFVATWASLLAGV